MALDREFIGTRTCQMNVNRRERNRLERMGDSKDRNYRCNDYQMVAQVRDAIKRPISQSAEFA